MFGKKKRPETPVAEPAPAPASASKTTGTEEKKSVDMTNQTNDPAQLQGARGEEKQRPLASLESRQPTVISKETRLNGDIDISGNLQIWGKIKGQITARAGTVSIMQSGVVEGDIIAETLLIDGVLTGTCSAEQLEILEHGELNGICRASNFSIRKGGTFIGQSEPYVAPQGSKQPAPQAAQAARQPQPAAKPREVFSHTEPQANAKADAGSAAAQSAAQPVKSADLPKADAKNDEQLQPAKGKDVPSVFKSM